MAVGPDELVEADSADGREPALLLPAEVAVEIVPIYLLWSLRRHLELEHDVLQKLRVLHVARGRENRLPEPVVYPALQIEPEERLVLAEAERALVRDLKRGELLVRPEKGPVAREIVRELEPRPKLTGALQKTTDEELEVHLTLSRTRARRALLTQPGEDRGRTQLDRVAPILIKENAILAHQPRVPPRELACRLSGPPRKKQLQSACAPLV